MKAGTIEHIKFKRLKRTLGLKDWQCVGLLESIWSFTARCHLDGAIGNSTDFDIALAIDYAEDETVLVNALVDAGWIDRSETHRLIVHDWQDHCPRYVKGNVVRYGKEFAANGNDSPSEPRKEPRKEIVTPPLDSPPSQVKPSLVKPSQAKEKIKKGFVRPAFEDVRDYFAELQHVEEAETFFDHFTSNGWKVGGKAAMKDWKSSARNWTRRRVGESSSVKPTTEWGQCLVASYGVKLTAEMEQAWFKELNHTFRNRWEGKPVDGLHKHLAKILRETLTLDIIPRKDRERKMAPYTVADFIVWIRLFNKGH